MDPEEALVRLRQFFGGREWDGDPIRDAFEGLDDWLCRGGRLPRDWAKARAKEAEGDG